MGAKPWTLVGINKPYFCGIRIRDLPFVCHQVTTLQNTSNRESNTRVHNRFTNLQSRKTYMHGRGMRHSSVIVISD